MKLFCNVCRLIVFLLLIPVVALDILYVAQYGWPFLHKGMKGLDRAVLGGVSHDEPLYKEVSPGVFEWRWETPKEIYTAFLEQVAILISLTATFIWIVRILNRKLRQIAAETVSPIQTSP
jgi:hypothetical protein